MPDNEYRSFFSRMRDRAQGIPNAADGMEEEDRKRARRIFLVILLIVFVLVSFYIGGCLAVLFNADLFGTGIGFFHAVRSSVTCTAGRFGTIAVFVVFMVIFAMIALGGRQHGAMDELGFTYSKRGTYGTSHMLKTEEFAEFLDLTGSAEETKGTILGRDPATKKIVSIPASSPYNRNISVCGNQGTMKSVTVARNMIIQCAVRGESILCTDPKGELYGDCAYYLKKNGYNVYQWNLVNRKNSDGCDILKLVDGDEPMQYVDTVCHTIISNTADQKNAGDFFDKIEEVLLRALVLYVIEHMPEGKRTLGEVYSMLLKYDADKLDALFASLEPTDPAAGAYNLFSQSPTNKGNAILGLGARLQIFQNETIRDMTGADEIDVEKLASEKTAIFCIVSDKENTYHVLNALFISLAFIKIMDYADRQPSRKCDVPVQILLDELPNIGEIDMLKQRVATARSRDIGMTLMFQQIPQMANRFPQMGYKELLGGCDFTLFLGCNETDTSKYYSELTGTATVEVDTTRKDLNTIRVTDWVAQSSHSVGDGRRATMMEDEIRGLKTDEMLLFVHGKKPIKLKKFPYFEHPESLKLRSVQPTRVIPKWRAEKEGLNADGISADGFEMTLDAACRAAELDDSAYVVKDSEKYGMQRERLEKEYMRLVDKYRNIGEFPNGVPCRMTGEKRQNETYASFMKAEDVSLKEKGRPLWEHRRNDRSSDLDRELAERRAARDRTAAPETEFERVIQAKEEEEAGTGTLNLGSVYDTKPDTARYVSPEPETVPEPVPMPDAASYDDDIWRDTERSWRDADLDDIMESLK